MPDNNQAENYGGKQGKAYLARQNKKIPNGSAQFPK